jgi:hypothetical protein
MGPDKFNFILISMSYKLDQRLFGRASARMDLILSSVMQANGFAQDIQRKCR